MLSGSGFGGASRWVARLPPFLQRALQVDQMEFDSALSQMYSLLVKPNVVSKMSKARKMTKNHYYRDDPAFVVLQLFFIVVTVVAYHLSLGNGFLALLYYIVYDITVYVITAFIGASVTLVVLTKYMMRDTFVNEARRDIEWQYCFDVHCNGYFVYFMWTRVVQYLLLHALLSTSMYACVISVLLFLGGCVSYFYTVFLGYLELPVLTSQQKLMYPVPVLAFVALVILFCNYNLTAAIVCYHWPAA
ncbi:UNC-50 family protein [Strigomonas culicis]|uniref:UNC-50 family protein n=1 Tax=Strigomonas culicis TaxID=28005 RepID=S9VXB1_9TRYP|nr:UNC-50 family protein [Strigomonas culicis]EPY33866.1 UNC-50 family protein [Strigomonas culicis]|eukprot:EPY31646.1 UNC-50 family protein [Strigomonas culicis]